MEVVLSDGALQGLCKVLVGQQRTLQTPTTDLFSDAYLHHVGTAPNTRLVLRPSINLKCDYVYICLCPCLLYVTVICSSALPVVYTYERNQLDGR